MHPVEAEAGSVDGCVWAGHWQPVLAGAHALHSQPAPCTDLCDTARKRGTHRVWADNKKHIFFVLELEWKFQHYLAAMSLVQTLVQEEPSHIWGNHVGFFSPGFILPTSVTSYSCAKPLPSSPPTGPDPLRGSANTTWEFMSKAAAQEEQGVFCCCTSEPWWPLEPVIALPIIHIILSGLGPGLNSLIPKPPAEINGLQHSCWL